MLQCRLQSPEAMRATSPQLLLEGPKVAVPIQHLLLLVPSRAAVAAALARRRDDASTLKKQPWPPKLLAGGAKDTLAQAPAEPRFGTWQEDENTRLHKRIKTSLLNIFRHSTLNS